MDPLQSMLAVRMVDAEGAPGAVTRAIFPSAMCTSQRIALSAGEDCA